MSIDKGKLKDLALAATPGQWVAEGEHINEHGHLLYAYVAHENSGMIAEAFANCRVKTDEECRANAAFIAGANPANVLALLSEIDAMHDRAAYWRQRAKSAEGHLHASDFQAACDALHLDSNYADIPAENLTEVQKARISSAVNMVLRAVNAQRDRRRPADVTDQRDNQNLTGQEE
ncbi:ead/Ea22-like family protein [Pseudomonas asiatica]|uniref:ead/Ea22-like family protein n=1 Tax=Pseudomonas asiatica TaxID=2219225 RepID=UPI002E7B188E|nr:ead/Ea22-like family protein [Pseudomonas asiatica]MEE1918445.1 ead/Ea22-like family protein [Pseudomonas asiatica]